MVIISQLPLNNKCPALECFYRSIFFLARRVSEYIYKKETINVIGTRESNLRFYWFPLRVKERASSAK